MTAEAAESASDTGASSVDDGMAPIDRASDDRPLVFDLSTAEVVQEALAALRADQVEPLDDALLPGLQFPQARRVGDAEPVRANRARHRKPQRQWYRLPQVWILASVGVVAAVGIALLTVTVINQPDSDGRQPAGQIQVTPEADDSRQLAPSSGPAAGPTDTASAGSATAGQGSAGQGSAGQDSATAGPDTASGNPAPTVGSPATPSVGTPPAETPTVGTEQPAVISSLADGDQGFGWPSSAFGTAGG
jgi:hypothetical protein